MIGQLGLRGAGELLGGLAASGLLGLRRVGQIFGVCHRFSVHRRQCVGARRIGQREACRRGGVV